MKLKPIALGIAAGVLWGGCIFITTILSVYNGYGKAFLEAIPESVYPGYSISASGSLIGLGYGLIDGFICGVIAGWLYNKAAGA